MKIGIISVGFLSHYCYCLANALADAGLEVVLYTDERYSFDKYETRFKLRKILGTTKEYYRWHSELITDVINEKLDVVHIQSYRKYLTLDTYLIYLLKKTEIPLVYTFHDLFTFHEQLKSYFTTSHHHFVLKYLYLPSFGSFIAHSETAREAIIKRYGIHENKITVIPHGIMDFYDFGSYSKSAARKTLEFLEDDFVLLYFGNIGRRKGLQSLIKAFKELKQQGHKDLILLMAGKGRDYFENHLRHIAGKEEIILYKDLKRIPEHDIEIIFKAADAVVLPYIESTTSGNLKIAIAFGKPVIATNVGEFPEYVDKYKIEIVQPGDHKGMAESIARIKSRRNVGGEIKSDLKGHYWNEIAEQTRTFYERARKV